MSRFENISEAAKDFKLKEAIEAAKKWRAWLFDLTPAKQDDTFRKEWRKANDALESAHREYKEFNKEIEQRKSTTPASKL